METPIVRIKLYLDDDSMVIIESRDDHGTISGALQRGGRVRRLEVTSTRTTVETLVENRYHITS